jgi:glycolate oxidase FAD binding subunit
VLSPDEVVRRIGAIVGVDRVRAPHENEELAASVIVEPGDASEIAEIVRACEAGRISLAAMGAARTLREIRQRPAALGVSLCRLNRIVAYEPDDMTVTVEAGVDVGTLNRSMQSAGQRLPVDPRDPDATTAGALIAASHAGPLRLSEGTVRDLLIGIRYVGHDGQVVHGGGRVVKNVAGYDLMKVMGGSYGTLGTITEATFKVRPIPEHSVLASLGFDRADDAFAAAGRLNDSFPLAHLEVLSSAASIASGFQSKPHVLAGIAGCLSEISEMRNAIGRLVPGMTFFESEEAQSVHARVRDFDVTAQSIAGQLAVRPAELAAMLVASKDEYIAHAGSGVAKVFGTEASGQAAADVVHRWRESAHHAGGHVRILHCERSLRQSIEFFDTPNDGALKLMRRMKSAFDPAGIFNSGCFVGGI